MAIWPQELLDPMARENINGLQAEIRSNKRLISELNHELKLKKDVIVAQREQIETADRAMYFDGQDLAVKEDVNRSLEKELREVRESRCEAEQQLRNARRENNQLLTSLMENNNELYNNQTRIDLLRDSVRQFNALLNDDIDIDNLSLSGEGMLRSSSLLSNSDIMFSPFFFYN